ncbi:YybH family protein [Gemmatimonadota bacterium]
MKRLTVVSLLVACTVLVGAVSLQAPQELSVEDIAAIQQTWQKWDEFGSADDLDGMLGLYTDNAVEIFNDGGVNVSKANIKLRWEPYRDFEYTAVDSEILDITGYGDTASVWTNNTMTYKTQPDAEPADSHTIYLAIMKKVDGTWKIAVLSWTQAE